MFSTISSGMVGEVEALAYVFSGVEEGGGEVEALAYVLTGVKEGGGVMGEIPFAIRNSFMILRNLLGSPWAAI